MKLRTSFSIASSAALLLAVAASMSIWHASAAQQPRIEIVAPGTVPNVAVTDFRATGAGQQFIATFNATVQADLQSSPLVKFVPKTRISVASAADAYRLPDHPCA